MSPAMAHALAEPKPRLQLSRCGQRRLSPKSVTLAARNQHTLNVAKLSSLFNHASAAVVATSYLLPSYSGIGKDPFQQPRGEATARFF